jgi:D-beta-D-heptose 7-phosphate kinase/D-beta-D-heptose 1-phosphate adenosyltransferase
MDKSLLKTVTNLGSPRVLLVGDFMLDVYIYGDALRISPEAPVPVLKVQETEYSCGGAGSVATDLAALGAVPICIGIIGDDRNGQVLKDKLTEVGADITGLLTDATRPTISKQRLVGLAQHRHRQQLMRMDRESTDQLSEHLSEALLQAYSDRLEEADIVCLQDYNKGSLSQAICRQVVQSSRQANKMVLVDPACISDYSKYTNATLITPNRQETSSVVGFEIRNGKDAAKAANELADKLKLEAVVITLDKEGAYLKTQKEDEVVPTRVRNVYDVSGAGDMVLATLAATLAAGCDYKTAVQLANITGGIEVEKFGAVPVTIDEVISEIIGQTRSSDGKVRTVDSLLTELTWHRKQDRTIVFTNGCFDVLHRGHIELLRFCKMQGDVVVVGLNSDSSVKAIKGPDRPVNNEHDRCAVLAALETVDYITVFDEDNPLNLIEKLKPNILIKGQDWAQQGVVGREFVESHGGKVILAPLVKGQSSSATIEKMRPQEENQ